ncbi:MAG: rod shape determining protein RodA [Verrucomicrobiota bacterium]|jgi:rod shape determining protein RodA|nr:rod shape determining protein RodA [Verrucomicrobiota bacterium]
MIDRIRRVDWIAVGTIMLLVVLSFLFIYSAGYRNNDQGINGMVIRQAVWVLIGLGCYTAAATFDYRKLRSIHWWIYSATLVLLLLVLFIGTSVYGAHRWFSIGGIMVQPSEFGKLAVIFTLAGWLGDPSTDVEELPVFFKAFVLTGIPFLLVVLEPDLGTAIVLIPVLFILLFCAGCSLRPLLTFVGIGVAALLVLIVWLRFFPDTCPFLSEYQKNRILVYLNVTKDPLGAGWNKLQSQIAVGSGGLFGKGYLKGTQNILGFLPRTVAPTDFIYSVVAEETGFAGSLVLLALYTTLIMRCMRAAVRARDRLGRLLAAGISVLIFTHVFVNIAMTVGLMPITGLPLPLMSYGGSFMVSTMIALGLVQSVYLRRRI